MPILGVLMLVAQIALAVHAGRTGRPFFWIYLILFLPMMGMLAYCAVELLPELAGTPRARRAVQGAMRLIDPEKEYRAALREIEIAETIETRSNLAAACLATKRYEEAARLYRGLLSGMHETDADFMLGLARAHFGAGDYWAAQTELEALRRANPDYRSAEGHLLYARSLELQGKREEALCQYEALIGYYPGQEAKCRLAALLKEAGEAERARELFEEVRRSVRLMPKHARRVQQEWSDFARRELTG
jgi:hypothetical protein